MDMFFLTNLTLVEFFLFISRISPISLRKYHEIGRKGLLSTFNLSPDVMEKYLRYENEQKHLNQLLLKIFQILPDRNKLCCLHF